MNVYLQTDRLVLRHFTMDDADNLFRLHSDAEVMRFIHAPLATLEDVIDRTLPRFLACHRHHPEYGYFAADLKETGDFIGWLHFRPAPENVTLFRPGVDDEHEIELGYRLARSAWGQGYATEASRALILKGFTELGVPRVTASAVVVNRASTRVMEKAGLRLVESYHHDSLKLDMVKYALDLEEWRRASTSAGTN